MAPFLSRVFCLKLLQRGQRQWHVLVLGYLSNPQCAWIILKRSENKAMVEPLRVERIDLPDADKGLLDLPETEKETTIKIFQLI